MHGEHTSSLYHRSKSSSPPFAGSILATSRYFALPVAVLLPSNACIGSQYVNVQADHVVTGWFLSGNMSLARGNLLIVPGLLTKLTSGTLYRAKYCVESVKSDDAFVLLIVWFEYRRAILAKPLFTMSRTWTLLYQLLNTSGDRTGLVM